MKTDRNTMMHIRVPKDLAAQIRETSKKENIAVGTALKFLIEHAAHEKIESRLICLEETVQKVQATVINLATIDLYYLLDKLTAQIEKEGVTPEIRKNLEFIKETLEKLEETENTGYENVCYLLENSEKHLRD